MYFMKSFFFLGDIRWIGVSSCPVPPFPLSSSASDDLRIYVSGSLLDCLLIAYEQSGAANRLTTQIIQQYLHLDNS